MTRDKTRSDGGMSRAVKTQRKRIYPPCSPMPYAIFTR